MPFSLQMPTKRMILVSKLKLTAPLITWSETFVRWAAELRQKNFILDDDFDWESWQPSFSGSGTLTFTPTTIHFAQFWDRGDHLQLSLHATGTTAGAGNTIYATLPRNITNSKAALSGWVIDGGGRLGAAAWVEDEYKVAISRYDAANFGAAAARQISISGRLNLR